MNEKVISNTNKLSLFQTVRLACGIVGTTAVLLCSGVHAADTPAKVPGLTPDDLARMATESDTDFLKRVPERYRHYPRDVLVQFVRIQAMKFVGSSAQVCGFEYNPPLTDAEVAKLSKWSLIGWWQDELKKNEEKIKAANFKAGYRITINGNARTKGMAADEFAAALLPTLEDYTKRGICNLPSEGAAKVCEYDTQDGISRLVVGGKVFSPAIDTSDEASLAPYDVMLALFDAGGFCTYNANRAFNAQLNQDPVGAAALAEWARLEAIRAKKIPLPPQ